MLSTDHQTLMTIFKKDECDQRGTKWLYRLAEFNFDINHILGKAMAVVDGLLRITGPGVANPSPDDDDEFPLQNFAVVAEDTIPPDLPATTLNPSCVSVRSLKARRFSLNQSFEPC